MLGISSRPPVKIELFLRHKETAPLYLDRSWKLSSMSTPFKRESTEYRGLPTPPEEDPMIYLEPKREDRKPNIIKGNTRATAQNSLPVVRPSREVDNGQSGGHNLAGRVQVSDQQPQHQNGTLHQKGVQPPRTRGVTPIQQPPTPFYPSNNIHGADVSMLDAPQSETGQEQQAQTGLHLVGRESKALVDALDKIRLLVDGSLSDDIPQVILVGDQSSGKSSLLSAIAGVNLPRGGSTCTRCPTNIKTASADKWACTVSLVEAYIYNEGETSDDQIYPCWMPRRSKKEYKFATIDDESDLEVVLKWAQIALLNPSLPPGTFEPGSQSCAQQAQKRSESRNYKEEALYSPNIIDISITAPDLHSLSFYDLPGLIQHADEGVYLPKAFKQMTRQYIRHRKSLIICAMAMHTDPENSTTRGLIYQEKAEDRTIGVLTMPDRVMNTTDSCYTSLFRGDQYKLKHGYFVTKQPGSDSVVRSGPQYHLSARQDECKFFNENRHWVNGGAWFLFRDRCGTKVIQKYLSQNFVELIKSCIPDMDMKLRSAVKQVEDKLADLPEEFLENASAIVRERLSDIKSGMRDLLSGKSKEFHSEWETICGQFQKGLEQMRPQCVCTDPSDKTIDLTETSDDEGFVHSNTPSRNIKRPATGGDDRQFKIRKLDDSPIAYKQEHSPRTPIRSSANTVTSWKQRVTCKPDTLGPFYQPYLDAGRNFMTIGGLRKEIAKEKRAGLPEASSDKVKEEYALLSVGRWYDPLDTLVKATFELLHRKLHDHLRSVLPAHADTELFQTSEQVIKDLVMEHQQVIHERVKMIYEVENSALFTINVPAFREYKEKAMGFLERDRQVARIDAYASTHPPHYPNGAKPEDRAKINEEWRSKILLELKPDPFAAEINVAAYIRCYYAVARHRFADSVCSTINAYLRKAVYQKVKYEIETRLRLDNSEVGPVNRCVEVLSGNGERVRLRAELAAQKKKLEMASKVLAELRKDGVADIGSDATMEDCNGGHVPI